MNPKSEEWMRQAIQLAVENVRSGHGGPFGAIVVNGDRLIATGVNQVTATHDPTAHAEIVAIRQACRSLGTFQLSGCEIYASCEPCPMCLAAIYWARLAACYYSRDRADAARAGLADAFLYEQFNLPERHRAIPSYRLLLEEGLRPFAEWMQSPNKIPY